jgi:hypothetical protein
MTSLSQHAVFDGAGSDASIATAAFASGEFPCDAACDHGRDTRRSFDGFWVPLECDVAQGSETVDEFGEAPRPDEVFVGQDVHQLSSQ